ncbi:MULTISPECIES: hypothetical protein [Bartonella]|uniref:hypothetical protein n=1 Tax=Bartonella TaxID=773 RepID=UPI003002617C
MLWVSNIINSKRIIEHYEIKLTAGKIDAVYFEEVRQRIRTNAARVCGNLLATLTTQCKYYHIPYVRKRQ